MVRNSEHFCQELHLSKWREGLFRFQLEEKRDQSLSVVQSLESIQGLLK